jgi:hypothetical protein
MKLNAEPEVTVPKAQPQVEEVAPTVQQAAPQAKTTTPKSKTVAQKPKTVEVTPEQSQRFEQIMALSKGGDKAQSAQGLRELKAEMEPEQYQVLQQQYLAARQGNALQGYQPKVGERSTTQVEHKIQSSATRLFPGEQWAQNCAPESCRQIIRASTGEKLSETDIQGVAAEVTKFHPLQGTPAKQVYKILEDRGVGTNNYANTPENIQIGVEEGHGVIANVDSRVLWKKPIKKGQEFNFEGHAVNVTGLVKDKTGTVTHYLINDTGTGKAGQKIPAKLFEEALLKNSEDYPAVMTDWPVSYGGRVASEARRKASKTFVEPDVNVQVSAEKSTSKSDPNVGTNQHTDRQAKIQKLQEQRKTVEAQRQLREGIKEAEARGVLEHIKKDFPEDWKWLNADPSGRRKELAFDPDTKKFDVQEAKAALQAEKDNVLGSPLRRAIDEYGGSQGGDYIDAKGKYWDVKEASAGTNKIVGVAQPKKGRPGENVLVDCTNLTAEQQNVLEAEIKSKLSDGAKEVRFIPARNN